MASQSLKILIALQYYIPHRTGLTLHVQRIAEGLAARGHEVTVLTARHDKRTPRDEQVINGVRVIRLWAPIRISRGMVMPAYLWAAFRLVQMHDVVSIHVPMLETFIFGFYTRLLHRGLVMTHHGDLILPQGLFNRFIVWATFKLYQIGGKAAHRILAYSHDYANHSYYIAPFRAKTSVVHPPIEIPRPDSEQVQVLRSTWTNEHTPETAKFIGYAGRFVEEKRPDVLIRSLPAIHKKYPDTKIVFAGEYDIRYEDFYNRHLSLIEEYQEHLIFLGLLQEPQAVADFYAACDVLALPSDTECFALVQVEAMQCGTPVVATDIPGARMVVQKTGMGEIVPPRNSEAMAAAIIRIFDNPAQYIKSLGEITEAFNLEETLDRYEKHLLNAARAARQ